MLMLDSLKILFYKILLSKFAKLPSLIYKKEEKRFCYVNTAKKTITDPRLYKN